MTPMKMPPDQEAEPVHGGTGRYGRRRGGGVPPVRWVGLALTLTLTLTLVGGLAAPDTRANDAERGGPPAQPAPQPATPARPEISPFALSQMDMDQFEYFGLQWWGSYIHVPEHERIIITGFSDYFVPGVLADGMRLRPRLFRQLLRNLNGVTDTEQRRTIINDAREQLKMEMDQHEASITRLQMQLPDDLGAGLSESEDGIYMAIRAERQGFFTARDADKNLEYWSRYPDEGAR